jgi:cytochrome c oxidase assembly factor CtaG
MPHLHHAALGSRGWVFLTLILVLTALVYLRGWLSVRALKVSWGWRAFSFLGGLLLIWVAVASPIAGLDHELLTVHMLQHLLLMTIAPPLIWLGAPVENVLRGLPWRFVKSSRVRLWRSRAAKKFAKTLGRPEFAWLAACAALVGWHIPTLFALGMQSAAWHRFENLSFLAAGLLFWRPVVQPSADASQQNLSMILYLFFATLPCDILSGFLAFCDRVVYPMYFSSSHLLGFSPLVDQQCAAALMWTCVTIVYLLAGAILTMRFLSPQGFPQAGSVRARLPGTEIGHRAAQSQEAF